MTLSNVVRTSYGRGRYHGGDDVTGEQDVIWGTIDTFNHTRTDGLVFCHGSSSDALSQSFGDAYVRAFNAELAKRYSVVVPDLGGPHTYGNDASMSATDDAVNYLNTLGAVDPVTMVAVSMGGATALNYAKRHPARVKALALLLPATDIEYLYTHAFVPIPSYIDEGYAGGWSQATYGAAHNPITFVNDLPANLPIHIWYAPDDTLVPPSMPLAFQAARPQTGLTELPNGGHTSQSQYNALPGVLDWLASL